MWQEINQEERNIIASMSDVVFRIQCNRLPVDHAALLTRAICDKAPYLASSSCAGVHAIHVAGSQNGWGRPENADDDLLLSKRTRLRIRIEQNKAEQLIAELSGSSLTVAGSTLNIISGSVSPLTPASTLLSRHVFFETDSALSKKPAPAEAEIDEALVDEEKFIENVVQHCIELGFSPTKVMCGLTHNVATHAGLRRTRSVLLADVPTQASIALQDNGVGDGRLMGCGLFIPHKDTQAVHDQQED